MDAMLWSRRYTVVSILNWIGFVAAALVLTWGQSKDALPPMTVAALVFLMTGSVAAQFVAAFRAIARSDEFLRAIALKQVVAAAGITMTATVGVGLGEQFLGLSELPMWLVYPFFWGIFGALTPFVTDSRP